METLVGIRVDQFHNPHGDRVGDRVGGVRLTPNINTKYTPLAADVSLSSSSTIGSSGGSSAGTRPRAWEATPAGLAAGHGLPKRPRLSPPPPPLKVPSAAGWATAPAVVPAAGAPADALREPSSTLPPWRPVAKAEAQPTLWRPAAKTEPLLQGWPDTASPRTVLPSLPTLLASVGAGAGAGAGSGRGSAGGTWPSTSAASSAAARATALPPGSSGTAAAPVGGPAGAVSPRRDARMDVRSLLSPEPISAGGGSASRSPFPPTAAASASTPTAVAATKTKHPCGICGKVLSSRTNLTRHIRGLHNREQTFLCPRCPATFLYRCQLASHTDTVHLRKRPYGCGVCGRAFGTRGHVKEHVALVHDRVAAGGSGPGGGGGLVCRVCGVSCRGRGALTLHLRVAHGGGRQYRCGGCERVYGYRSHLRRHLERRGGCGERPEGAALLAAMGSEVGRGSAEHDTTTPAVEVEAGGEGRGAPAS